MLAGTAKANAQAAKPVSNPSPNSSLQEQSQAPPETEGSIEESAPQGETSKPILDRRDRVFYPGDTERPRPLLRKLFLNIVLDQKDIFTSPFHANRHNALEWLLPLGVTGALIASDTHIANAFENSRGQVRWGGRISDIGASYTLIPIVAGSYVYGAWRDNPKAREIGVGSVKHAASFHREDRQMRVGRQVSCRPQPFEFSPKSGELCVRWLRHVNMWQIKPALDPR